jgi:hypothetical protein
MPGFNRRNFLKTAGLSALPIVIPGAASLAANGKGYTPPGTEPLVKLFGALPSARFYSHEGAKTQRIIL